MPSETDAAVRSGERLLAIGTGLLVGGGAFLLVASLVWWTSTSGVVAGLVGWSMGAGGAIRGGALRVIYCLKAENEQLRARLGPDANSGHLRTN